MAAKEEWIAHFESENGRKPSLKEFTAAKANDFAIGESIPDSQAVEESSAPDSKAVWSSHFESENGRKPTLQEFTDAKAKDFAIGESAPDSQAVEESTAPDSKSQAVEESSAPDPKAVWSSHFESENGRKPTLQEFTDAKAKDFAIGESAPDSQAVEESSAPDPKAVWSSHFESENGRKPTLQEFTSAKANDFAIGEPVPESQVVEESTAPDSESQAVEESSAPDSKSVWSSHFESENGRKPTLQEFTSAKANDFAIAEEASDSEAAVEESSSESTAPDSESSALSSKDAWTAYFESENGRKPRLPEFLEAKNNDFIIPESSEVLADSKEAEYSDEEGSETSESYAANLTLEPSDVAQIAAVTAMSEEAPTQADTTDTADTAAEPKRAKKSKKEAKEKTKKPRKHKNLWKFILAAVLAVIVIGAGISYYCASQYFSYTNQLKRYVSQYNSENGNIKKSLSSYFWADNKKTLTSADLKYLGKLPNSISTDEILKGTQFVKTGTQDLFFPVYKVQVQPQNLTFSTNTSGLNLTVNGEKVATSNSTSYSGGLSHLFPNTYEVAAIGTVSDQSVNLKQSVDLTSGEGAADFNLQYVTFNLYSNLTSGSVFIDNSQIGTLQNGSYKFVNIPVLGNGQLRVEKNFPSGIVKTSQVSVADISDGQSIYLNWNQEMTTNAATELMQAAFSDFSDYASDSDIDSDVSANFQNGENNPFFGTIKKIIDYNLNSAQRTAESISFSNVNVTGITQTDVNSYTVTFNVTYTFYYSSDTDPTNDTSGTLVQNFAMACTVGYNASNASNSDSSDSSDSSSDLSGSGSVGDLVSNFWITGNSGTSTMISQTNNIQ